MALRRINKEIKDLIEKGYKIDYPKGECHVFELDIYLPIPVESLYYPNEKDLVINFQFPTGYPFEFSKFIIKEDGDIIHPLINKTDRIMTLHCLITGEYASNKTLCTMETVLEKIKYYLINIPDKDICKDISLKCNCNKEIKSICDVICNFGIDFFVEQYVLKNRIISNQNKF